MKRIFICLLIIVLSLALFTACSNSGTSTPTSPPESVAATSPPASVENSDGLNDNAGGGSEQSDISLTDPNRKLIRTASMALETTAFEDSLSQLEAMCLQYEGYIESSKVLGESLTSSIKQFREARYTFRIPSVRYNEFMSSVGSIGNITNKEQSSQDVTDSYYDTESRLRVLRMRQERLEKQLEVATDSKAIINFENSLSDTLYEIEKLSGTLRRYDSLVEYSSISVKLLEVEEYTEIVPVVSEPETIGGRISKAFSSSVDALSNFFASLIVFILGNILYLFLLAAIAVGTLIIVKYCKKWRERKQRENAAK